MTFYKEALGLVDPMSEREKYRTLGGYYLGVANNFEQGIDTLQKLTVADAVITIPMKGEVMNLEGLPRKSTAEWIDVALILPDRDRTLFWLLIGAICARNVNWRHVGELWATVSAPDQEGYDGARHLLRQWKEEHAAFKQRMDLGA